MVFLNLNLVLFAILRHLKRRLLKINTKKYEKTKRVDITISQQLRFYEKPKMGKYWKIYNLACSSLACKASQASYTQVTEYPNKGVVSSERRVEMDAKEILVYMKQAEMQCELILEAGQELDRAIKQLQDWSEDWDCQRRACEDMYDSVHLILIHTNQLSRIFWPAKCCGELGLELCHRAMALRAEIDLPDLHHPLRNEALWRHADEFDHSVRDTNSSMRRYNAHHLTSFNQVITWMDNEAMFCWLEPANKSFVFHTEEFALAQLLDAAQQVQQNIQHYIKKQYQPSLSLAKPALYQYEKQWAN